MTDFRQQVRVKLEDTECLYIKIDDLNEARVEFENLAHHTWETLIALVDMITLGKRLELLSKAWPHFMKLIDDLMRSYLEEGLY